MSRTLRSVGLCLGLAAALCCSPGERGREEPRHSRPNILWIVWDTVRADHMSLYGHELPTTPNLDSWARGARVFDDCLSSAGYTLPSHASMFTGLSPSEHCTHNGTRRLGDPYTTVAELLRDAGYRTYMYSANPHVSKQGNLAQGFELAEHPWQPKYHDRALRLVQDKLPAEDRSSELRERLDAAEQGSWKLTGWNIKASGELAEEALLDWLATTDENRPFMAFLNYMEAHRPYIPPRRYREQLMSADEIARSYTIDRSWQSTWEYTFGLREYDDEEIRLTRATYDATLLELDNLFARLLAGLEAAGQLNNTVIVLTSDHGEQLGEHHMFDHQYSLYQPLLRVPLVIHYPSRFSPGRDDRPVMSFDLFPTLLELAGVDPPVGSSSTAISLVSPSEERLRLAEDPAPAELGLRMVKREHPQWNPIPWSRRLRALVDGSNKYIWSSDGRHELYDLGADLSESFNLYQSEPESAEQLRQALARHHASLALCNPDDAGLPEEPSPEQLELLRSLGYVN